MLEFKMVHLPFEFLILLKSDIHFAETVYFEKVLQDSPALRMILDKSFREFSQYNAGIEKIIGTLGYLHFRERLASFYIIKEIQGHFPDKTDLSFIQDIKKIEKRFYAICPNGNGRLFLLGFYLKFLNINQERLDLSLFELPLELDDIFSRFKIRSNQPDYFILLIWHLIIFFEKDQIFSMINQQMTWPQVFSYLSRNQQEHMLNNFLVYSASIQETSIFVDERV